MKKNGGAHRSCKIYGYINCFKLSNHVCRQIFLQLETTSHKVANRRLVNLSEMSQKHIKLWSVEIFTSLWTVCTCFNRINCLLLKEILFLSRFCGLVRGVYFRVKYSYHHYYSLPVVVWCVGQQASSLITRAVHSGWPLLWAPRARYRDTRVLRSRCFSQHLLFEKSVFLKNVVRQRLDTTSVWVTCLEVICTILHHKFLVTTHSIWVHLHREVSPFDAVSVINSRYQREIITAHQRPLNTT